MNEKQEQTEQLIAKYFSDVCILKSLSRKVSLGERAIPAFVLDWLISRYSNGKSVDAEKIQMFLARHLPDKSQNERLRNELVKGQIASC